MQILLLWRENCLEKNVDLHLSDRASLEITATWPENWAHYSLSQFYPFESQEKHNRGPFKILRATVTFFRLLSQGCSCPVCPWNIHMRMWMFLRRNSQWQRSDVFVLFLPQNTICNISCNLKACFQKSASFNSCFFPPYHFLVSFCFHSNLNVIQKEKEMHSPPKGNSVIIVNYIQVK